MLNSKPSIQTIDEGPERNLTRRQRESMQILMKALADFLQEDRYETESIAEHSYYDLEDVPEKKPQARKKPTAQRFQESEVKRADSSVSTAPSIGQISQSLVNACNVLIRESITFEYSLRTLGAGGPGMYGAWVLRRNLRAFSEVIEDCNIDELQTDSCQTDLSERYRLAPFIDGLPVTLYGLWKAFDELESFLLDFVSFFHSLDLNRVLQSLKGSLKKQHDSLLGLRTRTYIPPADGQVIRVNLLVFFLELEKSFQIFSSELSAFRRQGIPLIRTTQAGQSDRYLMFTTISTFFSAVTSATLQISFQEGPDDGGSVLVTAVNLFFFLSLIFSTASAVQALLAMAWIRSFIRVPNERLAYQWVSKGPLFSLVMSGVFFAIGLCLFVIASQKDSATTFFTVAFALIHTIALIAMTIWFVYEQWRFRRQSGPIGRKLTESSVMMSTLSWFMKIWQVQISVISNKPFSTFSGMLPKWRRSMRSGADSGNAEMSLPKEMTESDSDSFAVVVEPPSRPGSVLSAAVLAKRASEFSREADQSYFTSQVKENDERGHERETPAGNRNLEDGDARLSSPLERSDSLPFRSVSDVLASEDDRWTAGPSALRAEPGASSASWNTGSETLLGADLVEEPSLLANAGPSAGERYVWPNAQRAGPASQTSDFLQVRKESWQEGLRQDSITYMEMYNRRNPKKKRTYPSLDPRSPS